MRLAKNGEAFWLAGLGDQWAFLSRRDGVRRRTGIDDLSGTLAHIYDTVPVILLLHEPDRVGGIGL